MESTVSLKLELPIAPHLRYQFLLRVKELFIGEAKDLRLLVKECADGSAQLVYNPQEMQLCQVEQLVRKMGARLPEHYKQLHIDLEGIESVEAEELIRAQLKKIDGVLYASVSFPGKSVRVEIDLARVSHEEIVEQLFLMGYHPRDSKEKGRWSRYVELWMSGVAGLFLLIGWLGGYGSVGVGIAFSICSYFFSGFYPIKQALSAIASHRFDANILVFIACFGIGLIDMWMLGALTLFIYSAGKALEAYLLEALKQGMSATFSSDAKVKVYTDVGEEMRELSKITGGEVIYVPAGEELHFDGVVVEGESTVSETPLTGVASESLKCKGDSLFAGSVNGEGGLKMRVEGSSSKSAIARLYDRLFEAKSLPTAGRIFLGRCLRVYYPLLMIVLMMVWFSGPLFFGSALRQSYMLALNLMVAATPLALTILYEAPLFAALFALKRVGLWSKSERVLENLLFAKTILFDQWGTLTEGRPKITDLISMDCDESDLLAYAATLERMSLHPIAKAIVDEATVRRVPVIASQSHEGLSFGLRGKVDGKELIVATRRAFHEIPQRVLERAIELENSGKTCVIVKRDERWLGLIGLFDPLRGEVEEVLSELRGLSDAKVHLMTGESEPLARKYAEMAGIRHVHSGLSLSEKVNLIQSFEKRGGSTLLITDGIHDVPAMLSSSIGLLFDGKKQGVVIEASDITLMNNDFKSLSSLVRIVHAAKKVLRENIISYLLLLLLFVILTCAGVFNMALSMLFQIASMIALTWNASRIVKTR